MANIYQKIKASNKAKKAKEEENPLKFKNIDSKSAYGGGDALADPVEAVQSGKEAAEEATTDPPDEQGECINGVNTLTGKECDEKEDLDEDDKEFQKYDKETGEGGSEIGNALRKIFGKKNAAKMGGDHVKNKPAGVQPITKKASPIKTHEDGKEHTADDELAESLGTDASTQGQGTSSGVVNISGVENKYEYTGGVEGVKGVEGVAGTGGKTFEEAGVDPAEAQKYWDENPEEYKKYIAAKEGTPEVKAVEGKKSELKLTPQEEKIKGKSAYNMGWMETVNANWAEGSQRRGNERKEKGAIGNVKGNLTKNENKLFKQIKGEMRKSGNLPGGNADNRLAVLNEMGRRSTDAYKTDNPTDKTDYSKFSGYENYGRASSEISGSILDKSSEGYKDTVITGGEDKATNKIGSFYKQTDDEIKAKEGKGELTTAEKLKAENLLLN